MKEQILKLKEQTGAGIMNAKKALEDAGGDFEKAKAVLVKKGLEKAEKKSDRESTEGLIYAYIHGSDTNSGKAGVLLNMACETDFVAKNEQFIELCKEVAMQICAMQPENIEALLEMPYIRDSKKTIDGLIKETVAKLGENIFVKEFTRLAI